VHEVGQLIYSHFMMHGQRNIKLNFTTFLNTEPSYKKKNVYITEKVKVKSKSRFL